MVNARYILYQFKSEPSQIVPDIYSEYMEEERKRQVNSGPRMPDGKEKPWKKKKQQDTE